MASRFQGVEDLVFRGFLTTKAQIGGIHIVLKSLNSRELRSISERCPLKDSKDYYQVFEAMFLTYALYLVDGENVLPSRPGNITTLIDAMKEVPSNIRIGLLKEVLYLQKAQDTALRLLEAYSYGADSRHAWGMYRGKILNDPSLTGVMGTERLGVNSHQIAWAFLNQEEDGRIEAEQQWGFAKFVASAMNPKEVKKVDSKDKTRLKRLKEKRERALTGEIYDGPKHIEAHSVKELRQQLQADLDGKKDLHDRIIDAYEASIQKRRRDRVEEHERMIEDRRAERQRELESITDEELASGSGFVTILTSDQLQRRKKEQAENRLKFSRDMAERRKQAHIQNREDRKIATDQIRKLVQETEEAQETRQEAPRQPPREVDVTPRKNPRLQGGAPTPPKAPATKSGPAPKPPPGAKQVGTRPSGASEYLTTDPGSTVKAPEGYSAEKAIKGVGPSKRLTRRVPAPPSRRTKPVRKAAHTIHTDTPGEDDFFGGGGTTFTNKPEK